MTDDKTISAYDQNARDYVRLIEDEPPHASLLEFLAHLRPGSLILDLGCGPGKSAAAMISHGMHVDATDASAEMVRLAKQNYGIAARQSAFQDIPVTATYDGVWASFSLLHMPREEFPDYLPSLRAAIKTGGLLHLGMKIGSADVRDKLGRYYAYYTQRELNEFLDRSGFEVLSSTLGEGLGLAGDVEPWITILARAFDAG